MNDKSKVYEIAEGFETMQFDTETFLKTGELKPIDKPIKTDSNGIYELTEMNEGKFTLTRK